MFFLPSETEIGHYQMENPVEDFHQKQKPSQMLEIGLAEEFLLRQMCGMPTFHQNKGSNTKRTIEPQLVHSAVCQAF